MTRTILHLDMDAFYAAIEQRDDPSLRGRPVIVAGLGPRGVVTTASYEARPYGVRSAMPTVEARRRCPDGVYLPPRMDHYAAVSEAVFAEVTRFSPQIERLSLDEAFLDVSASRSLFGDGMAMAAALRTAVRDATGLAASVGVAGNKLLAKLASELAKPDGIREIPADAVQATLDPLPVGRLWTVGRVTGEALARLDIHTIGALRQADPVRLRRTLGRQVEGLQALARGEDERPVVADREGRSIGAEHTVDRDIDRLETARAWLLRLCERVGERARAEAQPGRTVTVKLRLPPFETHTRQASLPQATADTAVIYAQAEALLTRFWHEQKRPRLRLIGVSLSGFTAAEPSVQPDLFAALEPAPAPVATPRDALVDAINARFGRRSLTRAATLKTGE
ncbi:MAG: DNA polymerase IV [Xanthomonadales bacterium]|jgi:DNA polymerase-4|nr:DNA polymerase IV [Xanthomonadales bacterium]